MIFISHNVLRITMIQKTAKIIHRGTMDPYTAMGFVNIKLEIHVHTIIQLNCAIFLII